MQQSLGAKESIKPSNSFQFFKHWKEMILKKVEGGTSYLSFFYMVYELYIWLT